MLGLIELPIRGLITDHPELLLPHLRHDLPSSPRPSPRHEGNHIPYRSFRN